MTVRGISVAAGHRMSRQQVNGHVMELIPLPRFFTFTSFFPVFCCDAAAHMSKLKVK